MGSMGGFQLQLLDCEVSVFIIRESGFQNKMFLTLKVASKLYQLLLVDIAYAGTYVFMVDEHPWMRMNRNRNIPFSTRGRSLYNDIDLGPDGKPLFG